jgi:nucleoside-diphosphate-sugar epimerase
MKILVTGGAGYIGSALVPLLLSRGHTVRVLDRLDFGGKSLLGVWSDPGFELRRGDIREERTVTEAIAGIDAVVHLAAIVGDPACAREPDEARSTNLAASLALRDLCVERKVDRLVFASTCSNYGRMANTDSAVDESSELRPVSLYAELKVEVEKALLATPQEATVTTCLRFATAFGVSPRMRFDLTVNHFTMEMIARKRLTVFGERFWRPYIHIKDIAGAILAVLEAPAEKVSKGVYNVGSDSENFRKMDLIELIRPHAPDASVEFVHRDEDPRDYRVAFERIRRDLAFAATRTVSDGIGEVASLVKSGVIGDFDDPVYRN